MTRENLTGLRVVRAYNAEDYQEAKFTEANKELTETDAFSLIAFAGFTLYRSHVQYGFVPHMNRSVVKMPRLNP